MKHWITFNEPNTFTIGGYDTGTMAPGRCSNYVGNCTAGNSGTEPYIVVHHMILAHANAVNRYREKYQVSLQANFVTFMQIICHIKRWDKYVPNINLYANIYFFKVRGGSRSKVNFLFPETYQGIELKNM